MTSPDLAGDAPHTPRPYRPPIGIPERGERNGWRGLLGSIGLHLAFALVFLVPWVASEVLSVREKRNGGGPGASGGGGGGRGGTGGATVERLHYVPLIPTAPAAAPAAPTPPAPVVPPPPPPPTPQPTPQPTPPVTPPVPPPATQAAAPAEVPAAAASAAATLGQGGGSGNDGSAGAGPGSGGGVGSGIGTGRGSGLGPGSGGGPDSIYPATLVTLALPPLDAPRKLRPYRLIAYFDVDERGNTKLVGFNETPDSKFNRRLREVLAEVRFRPSVLASGRPVRDTVKFELEYP